jgi:hypothetical protein
MLFGAENIFKKLSDSKVSLLVGTGTLLVVSGLAIVFSQILLSEPQDLRKRALVADGTGELVFEPRPGATIESSASRKISIKLDPNSLPYSKVKLKFDVISNDIIEELAPTFIQASGLELSELQLYKVDHGYTVTFVATRQNAAQAAPSDPFTVLELRFKAKKDGEIKLSFNPEQTVMIGTSEKQDELKLFETFSYTIKKDSTPADGADPDDLYFDPLNNDTTKFTFRTVDTNAEVSPSQMVPNKTYKVSHTSYVQNIKKSQHAKDQTVTVQLKANGSQQTQAVLSYKSLASKSGGETTTLEGTFTAKDINKFVITLDPANTITERAEDNNSWEKEVRIGGSSTTSSGISIKQCNEVCTSNSECSTNQRCYNTGSDKRCRLATNVTSTSCGGLPNQGLNRSCNQYCADSRECGAGYTCWYNRCRIPGNVESTSCTSPQSTTTTVTGTTKGGLPITTVTYQGCNQNCASNRECQAGLRCYQGACRHPLNPKNVACSSDSSANGIDPTPAGTASPKPSASPSTSATPRPSATPSSSPVPPQLLASPAATTAAATSPTPAATPTPLPPATADESMFDSLALLVNSYITNLSNTPQVMGIPLPFLIIGAGILFLIIALLIFSFSRRKPKIAEAPKAPAPVTSAIHPPTGPQTIRQNPQPPQEVLAQRQTQQPVLSRPTVIPAAQPPAVVTHPAPPVVVAPAQQPAVVTQQQSTATTPQPASTTTQSSTPQTTEKLSMADRLKQKGVTMNGK